MGVARGDTRSIGAPYSVQAWLNGGWPREAILTGVKVAMQHRKGDPPSTLKYFEKAIARQHAELTRVLPKVELVDGPTIQVTHDRRSQGQGNIIQAADRLLETMRSFSADTKPGALAVRGGERARLLFGCFRKGEANDPVIFAAGIAANLALYPADVIEEVTSPVKGIATRVDWLPTIAEIRRACDEIMRPRRRRLLMMSRSESS